LRDVAEPQPRPAIRLGRCDVAAVQPHQAAGRRQEPHQRLEQRRFPGTIRPQEPEQLAARHDQVDAVQDLAPRDPPQ